MRGVKDRVVIVGADQLALFPHQGLGELIIIHPGHFIIPLEGEIKVASVNEHADSRHNTSSSIFLLILETRGSNYTRGGPAASASFNF
jgi:hypothetical protein